MGHLQAGIGRVNITPAIGARLVGFAARATGCTSIHDDLYATALVLDDGARQSALVSCDIISIHPDLIRQTRALVNAATGIPAANIMICCSHTHSGPPGYPTQRARPIDQSYVAHLPYRLAGVVQLACNDRAPARLGHSTGEATIGINRRQVVGPGTTMLGENPAGPVDRSVGILRVDRADGSPLATLVNHTCHPVILGPQSFAVSADFVGRTRAIVEAATGSTMLYMQGACGDINPLGGVQADYTNCYRLGTVLAGEIVRLYGSTEPQEVDLRLAATSGEVELDLAPLANALPAAETGRFAQGYVRLPYMGAHGPLMEIQAWAIGDLGIVAAAAEPFVETGLAAKAGSPFTRTFFAGYTNGCVGYVPTAQAYRLGGYEVLVAYRNYGLPEPPAPTAEQEVVRACRAALAHVHGS